MPPLYVHSEKIRRKARCTAPSDQAIHGYRMLAIIYISSLESISNLYALGWEAALSAAKKKPLHNKYKLPIPAPLKAKSSSYPHSLYDVLKALIKKKIIFNFFHSDKKKNEDCPGCTGCSRVRFPHQKSASNHSRRYSTKLFAQQFRWHRFAMHSGVIDTAVTCTAVWLTQHWHAHCTAVSLTPLCDPFVEYLREFEAIFVGFNPCIRGRRGGCLAKKKKHRGRKSRGRVPFNVSTATYFR
jgi:hypothetical protein